MKLRESFIGILMIMHGGNSGFFDQKETMLKCYVFKNIRHFECSKTHSVNMDMASVFQSVLYMDPRDGCHHGHCHHTDKRNWNFDLTRSWSWRIPHRIRHLNWWNLSSKRKSLRFAGLSCPEIEQVFQDLLKWSPVD